MLLTAADMSEKLKQLRIRARFTQEQLADYLGLSTPAVSRIENGHQVPDAVTYENWIWVCTHEVVRFNFVYDRRKGKHA